MSGRDISPTINTQIFIMAEYYITTVPDGRYLGYGPSGHPDSKRVPPPPQPVIILPEGTEAGKVSYTSCCAFDAPR